MKSPARIVIPVIIVSLVIAGGVYLVVRPSEPSAQPAQSRNTSAPTSAPANATKPQTDTPASAPGVYTPYNEAAVASTTGRRILFFHAVWCPQCRNIEATINQKGLPSGMTIFKVNYDTAQQLRQKYGVTLQTTFVEIDAAGALKKKHVAYDEPTIDAVLKALGQ